MLCVAVHNGTDEGGPVRYRVVTQNPTLLVVPHCLVADTFRGSFPDWLAVSPERFNQ